MLSFSSWGVLT